MIEEKARQKEIKRREDSKNTALVSKSKLLNKIFKKPDGKSERKGLVICYKCGQNSHTRDMCANYKWKCYSCERFTDSYLTQNCPAKNQKMNNMSNWGQNSGNYCRTEYKRNSQW